MQTSPTSADTTQALARAIDDLLPQTQCTKCGFAGCRPYALAIASGEARINQCPPGGPEGIERIARLLGCDILPPNPVHGTHGPMKVALIEERHCIGCTLCIQACPVDAILGTAKKMHTVIGELCTGCDLCIAPCPVDCIVMVDCVPARTWTDTDARAARARFEARERRRPREELENDMRLARKADFKLAVLDALEDPERDRKKAVIAAALERARARRQSRAK